MLTTPQPAVKEGSFLTLHYRLSSAEGKDIVSTFGESPATLQMGSGQLAPFLETCLLGLAEGAHQTFELTPEQAFGPRNPELLQRVSLETLRDWIVQLDGFADDRETLPVDCLEQIQTEWVELRL